MPKQQRAELTREAVLLAAARAFDRSGYAATTMNDIVALTGKTKGAVYFHFASKRDLAVAVIHRQQAVWPGVVDEVMARDHPPLQTLVELTHEVAHCFRDDVLVRAGVRLSVESDLVRTALPEPPYARWVEIVLGLLTRAAAAGEVTDEADLMGAARTLVSAFFGLQHVSAVLAERQDLEQRLAELWDLVLPGLRPR